LIDFAMNLPCRFSEDSQTIRSGSHGKSELFVTKVDPLDYAMSLYFELSPFDWIAPSELPGRFSAIEWLPFKSYYYAEPIAALSDLQKKVYSLIPLGFFTSALVSARAHGKSRLKPAVLCSVIAVGLELAQIGLQSRIPSTGDMIIFSFSAWAGIVLFDLINSLQHEPATSVPSSIE